MVSEAVCSCPPEFKSAQGNHKETTPGCRGLSPRWDPPPLFPASSFAPIRLRYLSPGTGGILPMYSEALPWSLTPHMNLRRPRGVSTWLSFLFLT